MTGHLLLLTLGPVQDFIAAARRTRDLWFGSHLLSEISRAAAASLAEADAELVFPALAKGDDELQPCDELLGPNGQLPLSVANKILAVLPAKANPADLARAAREAAQQRLRKLANDARKNADGLLAKDIDEVWPEQIGTLLEFCAAWSPIAEGEHGYRDARRAVEQAVAGRKNLREFAPWQARRPRAPKSSLDGARDSVLLPPLQRNAKKLQRYRLADNEQLDAVGVLKRCGGVPKQFVPLRNVAVAAWLAYAATAAPHELADVSVACGAIPDFPCVRETAGTQPFGFDAGVLFPDRWSALAKELRQDNGLPDGLKQAVQALLKKIGEPTPYVCCLAADGDRMGVTLDALPSADQHRDFSRKLAAFAPAARAIVESAEHLGALVYAGGDDVLAFVPVDRALACAKALQQKFVELLGGAGPTLSVGLGIGHTLTGMGDLLDLARRAEKEAKKKRNSLAVIVQKRTGGEDSWTAMWPDDPVGHITTAVNALDGRLPAKKVSEVRERLRRSPEPGDRADAARATALAEAKWADVLRQEVTRILARSFGGERPLKPADVGLVLPAVDDYRAVWEAVDAWVNLLRLAMLFEAANPNPQPAAPATEEVAHE